MKKKKKKNNKPREEWQVKATMDYLNETFTGEGSVHPMFFGYNARVGYFMPIGWDTKEDRRKMLRKLRMFCYVYELDHYLTLNETWMSRECIKLGVEPREDPDRISSVMLLSVDRNRVRGIFYEINGDKLKRIDHGSPNVTGDMTKFLPPEGVPKPTEDLKKQFLKAFDLNFERI